MSTAELHTRLEREQAAEAELDAKLEALRASRAATLASLRGRAEAARLALEDARRRQSARQAEVEGLRAELARISSGLYGLRLGWVRFGEPAVASLAPLVSGLVLRLGGVFHHRGLGTSSAAGAVAGALVALLTHRGARR